MQMKRNYHGWTVRFQRLSVSIFLAALMLPAAVQAVCPVNVTVCEQFEPGRTVAVGSLTSFGDGRGVSPHHVLVLDRLDGAFLLPEAGTALAVHVGAPYYVQARVRPGVGAGQGVVLARYSDPDNWLGVRIGIRAGSLRLDVDLVRMQNGELKRLRQGDADLDAPDSLYTVRVDVGTSKVTAYVNGSPIHSADEMAQPPQRVGVLAQAGAVAFDDVRLGRVQAAPVRLALIGRGNRVSLQAGDAPQRYQVRALLPAGAAAPRLVANSNAPDVAHAAISGDELVVTALRAGAAIITVADRDDASVTMAIGARVGPAFAATGAEPLLRDQASPAPGARDVPPDTQLKLRFDAPPVLSGEGSVRIFRTRDGALVDVIGASNEVNTIGAAADGHRRVVRFSPLQVRGNTLSIRPHDGRLDYDTAYHVLLDGILVGGAQIDGRVFAGIGKAATWQFRTRTRAPGSGPLQVGPTAQADFRTVQGALNHVMRRVARATPVTITVADGVYDDLLYLRGKDNVTLRGQSRAGTVIASRNGNGLNPGAGGGQSASAPGITGGRSVLLVEDADLLRLDRITLTNTMARADVLGGQAEAVHFSGAGRLVVTDSTLVSEQDTVLVRGYAWFYRSLIAGNVDFIWGYSPATLFEDSEIRSVGDTAGTGNGGYIVQARAVNRDDPGFVFLNSRITHGPGPAGNDVPAGSSYLARTGASTTWDNVAFINCRIGPHIAARGWHGQPREGRGWYEFSSMDAEGRPLDLSGRSAGLALTSAQAARFSSRQQVFSGFDRGRGWDPSELAH